METASSTCSDLDGDGAPDILVAGVTADRGGTDAGAVWAFFGPIGAGTVLGADEADAVWVGEEGDRLGVIRPPRDLDGDGADDLIVTAPGAVESTGEAWFLTGQGR